MESAKYFIAVGLLLFVLAISPRLLEKSPLTPSAVYLLFGILLGPQGIDLLRLDPSIHSKTIELVAELTVIVSIFTVGLKLRRDFEDRLWMLPVSLATVSMLITIGSVTLIGYFFLGLTPGVSVLLGAIVAPTDPVLASEVQLQDPNDRNENKFILTSEGGMNDGTAFPFVMLGLGIVGSASKDWSWGTWFMKDLLWAIFVGLGVGFLTGILMARIARLVKVSEKKYFLEDFMTISSIALSYGLALQFHGYGFLAVFANALTFRQLELRTPSHSGHELPDEVLSFNEQLERIFEVVSVGTVGILLDFRTFSWSAAILAVFLIIIARPLSVFIGTLGTSIADKEKVFLSWFGVRGIGSLYYLFFAINAAGPDLPTEILLHYTLWIIFFSIFLHGVSAKVLLKRLAKRKVEY